MREVEATKEFGGEKDGGEFTKFEIAKLELHDGDIVVLRTDQHLTREQVELLEYKAVKMFPGIKVVILTAGLSLAVVQDRRSP